jgi:alkylglycerol monooxygenase
MQEYANVLSIALPFFIFLIIVEWYVGFRKNNVTIRSFDTISSLSSGITNTLKQILGLTIVIISYKYLYAHFSIIEIKNQWYIYVIGFIGIDFAGYWTHRFEHVINILWNRHIIHHSSEEFNLACALRQNISAIFALFTILLLPCAILGIPPSVISVIAPLHLFAQFWYHTRLINKMGLLEYVIVTPSHHRVHHAINEIYIDKNFGQIFIIWDKWFGTFQVELEDEKPVYGLKKPVNTWNPILINFQHLLQLIKDAWRTNSIRDKFKIWFMPTGWRPNDVSTKYPITILHPKQQVKYDATGNIYLHLWCWFQFVVTLCLMLHMFTAISSYSFYHLLFYGLFLTVSIYANTALMDHDRAAIFAEILRFSMVVMFVNFEGNWFGISLGLPLIFVFISILVCIYFLFLEKKVTTHHVTAS